MRARPLAIAAAALLLAATGGTVVLAQSAGPAPAEELLTLLARAEQSTYHARYSLTAADPDDTQGSPKVEVWRAGPDRVRQDANRADDGRTGSVAAIRDAAVLVRCEQVQPAPWTCRREAGDPLDGPGSLRAQVVAALEGATVAARSERVSRWDARCFTIRSADGGLVAELCLGPDGVPVRIAFDTLRLEALTVDGQVRDTDFTPPAPVT